MGGLVGPQQSWTRDRRVWFFAIAVVTVVAIDIALPSSVVFQPFVALPIVGSAVLGRPGVTAVLAALGLVGLAISTAANDYPVGEAGWRFIVVVLVAAASIALATTFARQQRYRILAENASDIVYAADAAHRLLWVSPSLTRILGWAPADLVGSDPVDLVHSEDRRSLREEVTRVGAGGRMPSGLLVRVYDHSGQAHWTLWHARRIPGAPGDADRIVGTMSLVDELVAAREETRAQEERLAATLRSMLDPHVLLTPLRDSAGVVHDLAVTDANDAAVADLGRESLDLVGNRASEVMPWREIDSLLAVCVAAVEGDEPVVIDQAKVHDRLRTRDVDIRAVPVADALSLTWRDVTDRMEATQRIAESEERYRLLAENSTDVVVVLRDDLVEWVSPSVHEALGWTREDWLGQPFDRIIDPADVDGLIGPKSQAEAGEKVSTILRMRSKAGDYHWIYLRAGPFVDADGDIAGIVCTFRVTDEEMALWNEMQRRAEFDDLTGALTREAAFQRIDALRTEGHEPLALLFCDLDLFKDVNDTLGHAAGDAVLVEAVRRLRSAIRGDDPVARLGGDEFLVVLPSVGDPTDAVRVADDIRERVAQPMAHEGHGIDVSMSIGIAMLRAGDDVDDVINQADAAMYEAKRSGRNRVISSP